MWPYNQSVSNSCEGVIVLRYGQCFTKTKVPVVHYLDASSMLGVAVASCVYYLILTAIREVDIIVFRLQMRKPTFRDVWELAQYHTVTKGQFKDLAFLI